MAKLIQRIGLLCAVALAGAGTARPAVPIALPSGAATEFRAQATWKAPSTAEVRALVLKWLDERKAASDLRAQVEKLWPAEETAAIGGAELLDRVGATIALVEPAAKPLVDFCAKPAVDVEAPDLSLLADEKVDSFARDNLRLMLGRTWALARRYDDALAQIGKLEPQDVVDPVSLLFYQSVCHHWFLDKAAGAATIAKLFERRDELPRRYATMAMLMQADLAALKDESLDHISRRMNDVTRRLDFGSSGKKVQGVENGVIASLDKLIEELEKQAQAQSGAGGGDGGQGQPGSRGQPQGIQSRGPAADSMPAVGKGAGNIDRKRIGGSSGWGDLPAKEREEALQQIGKDFPSHYRDIVESYFRKIAESE